MKTDDMKLNILYITNVPSPYRVDYFNELGKLCNLTVLLKKAHQMKEILLGENIILQILKGLF